MDQDKTFPTPKRNPGYYRWSCVSPSSSKQLCCVGRFDFYRLIDLESKHPSSGIILLGDFNQLNVSRLTFNFGLNRIVNFGTRGPKNLDKVLTNLKSFYDQPTKRAGFGLSDHFSIEVQPKQRPLTCKQKHIFLARDLRPSNRLAMWSYLELVDVPGLSLKVPVRLSYLCFSIHHNRFRCYITILVQNRL